MNLIIHLHFSKFPDLLIGKISGHNHSFANYEDFVFLTIIFLGINKLLLFGYRFKTEAYDTVVNRFNERFLLSLVDNPRCLVLDDSLTVLPISSKTAQVDPVNSVPEVSFLFYRIVNNQMVRLKEREINCL